jgi:hypothetical protein
MSAVLGMPPGARDSMQCIGAGCMFWRWEIDLQGRIKSEPATAPTWQEGRLGYCGLAGKP